MRCHGGGTDPNDKTKCHGSCWSDRGCCPHERGGGGGHNVTGGGGGTTNLYHSITV